MGQFDSIFGNIMRAKPMNNYLPRLPNGSHTLVLVKYKPKNSDQGMGTILEADFLVGRSTDTALNQGDKRGWPWFIESKGFSGQYEQDRAKQFIEAVMRSINVDELPRDAQGSIINPLTGHVFFQVNDQGMPVINPATGQALAKTAHDTMTIGELLTLGYFRGVQVAADVTPQIDKKTGGARVDSKGKPVSNATWKAIPGQGLAQIAEMRASVDAIDPPESAAPAAPTASFAPANQPAPVAKTTTTTTTLAAPAPVAPPAPTAPPAGPLGGMLAGLRKGG